MKYERKYTTQKNRIINYLKDKDLYDKVDTMLIEKLIYLIRLTDMCEVDMEEKGFSMNVSKEENKPYYQQNPSVSIYQQSIKQISTIASKLGLTVQDRIKTKIKEPEETKKEITLQELLNGENEI